MMPDELTQVMPPRRIAAGVDQLSKQTENESGREVEDHVEQPGKQAGAHTGSELVGGVLESKREKQQEYADLCRQRDEVAARGHVDTNLPSLNARPAIR